MQLSMLEKKYHSGLQIFLDLGSVVFGLNSTWNYIKLQGSSLGLVFGLLGIGFGLYELVVELHGPLVAFYEYGITLRHPNRALFVTIEWQMIEHIKKGRMGMHFSYTILKKDGTESVVPVFLFYGKKRNSLCALLDDIQAQLGRAQGGLDTCKRDNGVET